MAQGDGLLSAAGDWMRRPAVHWPLVVGGFVGALGLHAGLSNFPLPVAIDGSDPMRAGAGEELVIKGPAFGAPLLHHVRGLGDTVDVFFDRARPAPGPRDDIGILSPPRGPDGKTIPLPTGYGEVEFIESAHPSTRAGGRPCELQLEMEWKTRPGPGTELHFWQPRGVDASPEPMVAVRARGAQMRVLLCPISTGGPQGPGCWKWLRIGPRWKHVVGDSNKIQLEVAENSSVRFYFHSVTPGGTLGGPSGRYQPFTWGDVAGGLRAQEVRVQASPEAVGGTAGPPKRSVRCARRDRPLSVSALVFRTETGELEVAAAGRGWPAVEGRPKGVDLATQLKDNPVIGGLLTAFYGAAVAGVTGLVTGGRQDQGGAPSLPRRRRPQAPGEPGHGPLRGRRRRRG